jgi:hypothetical protein
VEDVHDTLIERHTTTDTEDGDRHDVRPEVKRLAVTEWVTLIGRLPGSFHPQQYEAAISRIDERMDAFRYHGRRAGHGRCNEFDDCDDQITNDSRDDRYVRTALRCHGFHPVDHDKIEIESREIDEESREQGAGENPYERAVITSITAQAFMLLVVYPQQSGSYHPIILWIGVPGEFQRFVFPPHHV